MMKDFALVVYLGLNMHGYSNTFSLNLKTLTVTQFLWASCSLFTWLGQRGLDLADPLGLKIVFGNFYGVLTFKMFSL